MTARYWIDSCVARIDAAEYRLCRRMNRASSLSSLKQAFRVASRLGDGMAWSRNLAEVTRAGVAHLRGDDAAARAALARAQLGFDADGAALFAAVTTLRRAQLDGDERARRDAHAAIAACGVADAACFAAMLAPGF